MYRFKMEEYKEVIESCRDYFEFSDLEKVTLRDARNTDLYRKLYDDAANKNNAGPFNASILFSQLYKNGVIYFRDNMDMCCKELPKNEFKGQDNQILMDLYEPTDKTIYRMPRAYDFITGFRVRGAKEVTSCKLVMIPNTFRDKKSFEIDLSDQFNGNDDVTVNFLDDNLFTYSTKEVNYNYCTGLPHVIFGYTNSYLMFSGVDKIDISLMTIVVSSNYRVNIGKGKPTQFKIREEIFFCKDGYVVKNIDFDKVV